jgi:phosphoribosylformimino-5-aminoimidazole carboxamide ribotide isomerase
MNTFGGDAMRVIPVMDLRDGLAVHAKSGEREDYQPVVSVLTDNAEPLSVARAFHEKLDLSELYIADLNAIQGCGHHRALISRLAQHSGMSLNVDAGASDVTSALQVLETGASRVIIGAETLASWGTLLAIGAAIPAHRRIFSLDMRAGRILSRCLELSASTPMEVLSRLHQAGWREVILLDLARVGTALGAGQDLVRQARQAFPGLSLLVGGGVRDLAELEALGALGVAGVLLATALHAGALTRLQIDRLTLK